MDLLVPRACVSSRREVGESGCQSEIRHFGQDIGAVTAGLELQAGPLGGRGEQWGKASWKHSPMPTDNSFSLSSQTLLVVLKVPGSPLLLCLFLEVVVVVVVLQKYLEFGGSLVVISKNSKE